MTNLAAYVASLVALVALGVTGVVEGELLAGLVGSVIGGAALPSVRGTGS